MTVNGSLALISVSIDLGAGRRGVDMGPSALRIAGITDSIGAIGYRVVEAGSVTAGGFEVSDPGETSLRFLDEVLCVADRANQLVADNLDEGHFPLILGGDHSLSIGTVAAVAGHYRRRDERIGVIWVDAHADLNQGHTTPSGNIHGMSLAVLLGCGDARLTGIGGPEPSVRPENTCVLGARELDEGERKTIEELGIRVFTMPELDDRGAGRCMEEAIARASQGTSGFHLSYDLDALDPSVAPGVGTPVMGGLTYREGHLVAEKAAGSGRLLSLELVELNPVLDDRNRTAEVGVGLIASALGRKIL
ncbi:MAG: arginase [Gemmatimonadetes bacterium]|nr:arginase [Gemmatimonadota bacterium]